MAKSPFDIISECSDPKKLRSMMENARHQEREDVWRAAFSNLCELAGSTHDTELDRDFHSTLQAYEELLTQKNGRTTTAAYTRRKLNNKGVIHCLEDWAIDPKETDGFKLLVQKGMPQLTGEYIVLKFPQHFSLAAIECAKKKLAKHQIELP